MLSIFGPEHIGKIIALIPTYDKGTNSTIVITTEKKLIVRRQCRTVIKHLAKANFTDLKAVHEVSRAHLGRRRSLPLCIGQKLFLIPFSLREPKRKNDSTLGYFNDNFIDTICLANGKYIMRLRSGHEFFLRKRAECHRLRLEQYKILKRQLYCG